ncbi:Uncharacterised protein family (UPF0014) [Melghirimyces thermohalophilus]|uniref:Uncharacterized protein family (UPF0014) n=1 Tax=Melghirimyces thermohalophilus TaxID=1236220 RepID=A0A1G6PFS4_9BACL|nr:ABC transporter permease [Melghirimyces thermohalophilus]SDC79102.1 Uncharacterised protein family (UPF0014) [Melghirimyces thermohalophilus]
MGDQELIRLVGVTKRYTGQRIPLDGECRNHAGRDFGRSLPGGYRSAGQPPGYLPGHSGGDDSDDRFLLSGMMTGLIIAGTSPLIAVRYQLLIMYSITASSALVSIILGMLVRPV